MGHLQAASKAPMSRGKHSLLWNTSGRLWAFQMTIWLAISSMIRSPPSSSVRDPRFPALMTRFNTCISVLFSFGSKRGYHFHHAPSASLSLSLVFFLFFFSSSVPYTRGLLSSSAGTSLLSRESKAPSKLSKTCQASR